MPPPLYGVAPPKPGCVPLRPLGLGDILDGSFTAIRRNPRATLGLSAVVAVIQVSITAILQILAFSQLGKVIDDTDAANPQVNFGPLLAQIPGALGILFISAIFGAVLTGMLTVVISEDVLGNQTSISEVWARVRPQLGRLIGLSLLVGIVPSLALFLFVAPGVWLWGIWAVAVPALIVERTGVGASLGRSRDLVRGTFWRIWGIRALGMLIISMVGGIVSLPFTAIATAITGSSLTNFGQTGGLSVIYILITSIGSILVTTLVAPVRAGIDALLYVDLRMRKEGLDIVLQQAAARQSA
jgi:hypothetical protein